MASLKYLLFIISVVYATASQAGYGVITVHEAPIHKLPKLNSKVVQYARKGAKIYIPSSYFHQSNIRQHLPQDENYIKNKRTKETPTLSFYKTLDRNGNTVFILKEHVKLIYQDGREITQLIRPYKKDPTDYRLKEPLPANYPFLREKAYRASFALIMGPDIKSHYNYNQNLEVVQTSQRTGLSFNYLKKANWDNRDQFYFGGVFSWWGSSTDINLSNNYTAKEVKSHVSFGPLITYDLWKNESYLLTGALSLNLTYTRLAVSQTSRNDDITQERTFSGFNLMPKLQTTFAIRNISDNLDFIVGLSSQFFLSHDLQANPTQSNGNFWTGDSVSSSLNAYWSGLVGLRGHY